MLCPAVRCLSPTRHRGAFRCRVSGSAAKSAINLTRRCAFDERRATSRGACRDDDCTRVSRAVGSAIAQQSPAPTRILRSSRRFFAASNTATTPAGRLNGTGSVDALELAMRVIITRGSSVGDDCTTVRCISVGNRTPRVCLPGSRPSSAQALSIFPRPPARTCPVSHLLYHEPRARRPSGGYDRCPVTSVRRPPL